MLTKEMEKSLKPYRCALYGLALVISVFFFKQVAVDLNFAGNRVFSSPQQLSLLFNPLNIFKRHSKNASENSGNDNTLLTQHIRYAASKHSVDPKLIKAVISIESGFNPVAISNKGAQGLMQLMPETAVYLGAQDPLDPRENIIAGSKYLRLLLDQFHNNLDLALAAYNAGPTRVRQYGGIPPFKETRNFVQKVKQAYNGYLNSTSSQS